VQSSSAVCLHSAPKAATLAHVYTIADCWLSQQRAQNCNTLSTLPPCCTHYFPFTFSMHSRANLCHTHMHLDLACTTLATWDKAMPQDRSTSRPVQMHCSYPAAHMLYQPHPLQVTANPEHNFLSESRCSSQRWCMYFQLLLEHFCAPACKYCRLCCS
jgi:hypothetical protein